MPKRVDRQGIREEKRGQANYVRNTLGNRRKQLKRLVLIRIIREPAD